MHFQHPLLLLLLVPLGAAGWLHYRRSLSADRRRRAWLVLGAGASLIAALSNPYWSYTREKTVVRGVDFVILLDVSQSMYCMEGGMRRMDRASRLLLTLVPRLSGSSVGILYFAGDAQIGSPLTPDLGAIPLFLESVIPGMTASMGSRTTPLPEAIQQLLSARESSRKAIGLMFSDGEFEDGAGPLQRWLKNHPEFTLFTVACGRERAQVPELDLDLLHPLAFSQPNPSSLQALATAGGGRSFDISAGAPESLEDLLLSNVRETVTAGRPVPAYQPYPFLILAVAFLLLYQFFPRERLPGIEKRQVIAAASLAVLLFASAAMKSDEERSGLFVSAMKDIKQNKLDEAERKLQMLRQSGPSDEVEVALGNVRVLRKQYDDAIRYYSQAVRHNPGNTTARWNWEVALKRKSKESQPPVPPPPQPPPQQLPQEANALLKYFDQLEKDQIKKNNSQQDKKAEFAW